MGFAMRTQNTQNVQCVNHFLDAWSTLVVISDLCSSVNALFQCFCVCASCERGIFCGMLCYAAPNVEGKLYVLNACAWTATYTREPSFVAPCSRLQIDDAHLRLDMEWNGTLIGCDANAARREGSTVVYVIS